MDTGGESEGTAGANAEGYKERILSIMEERSKFIHGGGRHESYRIENELSETPTRPWISGKITGISREEVSDKEKDDRAEGFRGRLISIRQERKNKIPVEQSRF